MTHPEVNSAAPLLVHQVQVREKSSSPFNTVIMFVPQQEVNKINFHLQ